MEDNIFLPSKCDLYLELRGWFFKFAICRTQFQYLYYRYIYIYIINIFMSTSLLWNTCYRILLHLFFPATES